VESLIKAGVDMVMLPVPGTVPGASIETVAESIAVAHQMGALAEVTIGTSQESSEVETIRRLAMDSKLTGADIFQIGDGGYGGIAIPENILAFATAIKGKRHTYRRMAMRKR
jgi:collagenase-like PrtC family protease